jgi:hypothetical protein
MAFFLFSLAIPFIVVEYMLRRIPNDYMLKREYLDKNSDIIEILFLGSSHSYYGINPEYTKRKSFNASYVSQTLDYNFEILRKYENKWSSLEYIVLTISYPSLFSKLEEISERWRIKNYVLYYDIKISNNLVYWSEILNGPMTDHLRKLYGYYVKNDCYVRSTDLGWGPSSHSASMEELVKTGSEAALRNTLPEERRYNHFKAMSSSLDSIIGFARDHNCKVILITTPAYISFRENLDKGQLDFTNNYITDLAKTFNTCFYFNWLDDGNFTEIDFRDGDHLNAIGARKLTLMVDSIIKKLDHDFHAGEKGNSN